MVDRAIGRLLSVCPSEGGADVLWQVRYKHAFPAARAAEMDDYGAILVHDIAPSFVLDDDVLEGVRAVWERVTGEEGEGFMEFGGGGEEGGEETAG